MPWQERAMAEDRFIWIAAQRSGGAAQRSEGAAQRSGGAAQQPEVPRCPTVGTQAPKSCRKVVACGRNMLSFRDL